MFACLARDRLNRAILAAILNKQLIDCLPGAKCFQNRIAAFNG
jgi:hypothetical protein